MSSPAERREKIRRYQETPRPAGVFRVRNAATGRALLGSAPDAPARLNRERTQLKLGAHPNRALQRDWAALGPDAFEFEVLDLLEPRGGEADVAEELATLEELWIERLGLTERDRY